MLSQNVTPLLKWMCYPLSGFVEAKRTSLKRMVQQKKLKSTEEKFLYSIFEQKTNCNEENSICCCIGVYGDVCLISASLVISVIWLSTS